MTSRCVGKGPNRKVRPLCLDASEGVGLMGSPLRGGLLGANADDHEAGVSEDLVGAPARHVIEIAVILAREAPMPKRAAPRIPFCRTVLAASRASVQLPLTARWRSPETGLHEANGPVSASHAYVFGTANRTAVAAAGRTLHAEACDAGPMTWGLAVAVGCEKNSSEDRNSSFSFSDPVPTLRLSMFGPAKNPSAKLHSRERSARECRKGTKEELDDCHVHR